MRGRDYSPSLRVTSRRPHLSSRPRLHSLGGFLCARRSSGFYAPCHQKDLAARCSVPLPRCPPCSAPSRGARDTAGSPTRPWGGLNVSLGCTEPGLFSPRQQRGAVPGTAAEPPALPSTKSRWDPQDLCFALLSLSSLNRDARQLHLSQINSGKSQGSRSVNETSAAAPLPFKSPGWWGIFGRQLTNNRRAERGKPPPGEM